MGRAWISGCVAALALAMAPVGLAKTQSAHSADVTAILSFKGSTPKVTDQRLRIVRGGKTLYDARVKSKFCGSDCAPLTSGRSHTSLHVLDLERVGSPDVVLDLFSGGAHCCVIEQVFSLDPGTMTYAMTEWDFGDPGDRIVDLDHNGRFEFLTANDAFAYAFTDFAASGLPVQVLTFAGRRFHDVTTRYPKLIAHDAEVYLRLFKRMAKSGYRDRVGVIAAWAADEDMLGRSRQAASYLNAQAKAGHLNSALDPKLRGERFVVKLQKFLRKHGYLH